MSTTVLPGYPRQPRHIYTTTLGEQAYRFTFTYRARTQAWYFDLALEDGTELVNGRKVSAAWSPLGAVDLGSNAPAGALWVRGPDNYEQADWGADLRLVFIPQADIDAANALVTSGAALGLVYTVN